MKKYNITVNGNSYIVDVEEVKESESSSVVQATIPSKAPVKREVSTTEAKKDQKIDVVPVSTAPSGLGGVKAPMPGTINDIKVSQGDSVRAGQVLLILEAMKMENEIQSPKDGVIQSIHTTKGASVSTGDVLVVVE